MLKKIMPITIVVKLKDGIVINKDLYDAHQKLFVSSPVAYKMIHVDRFGKVRRTPYVKL
jgi:hypothetical protein